MSVVEVVAMVVAVIAADSVLPEIPKIWRKAVKPSTSTQIERYRHREILDPRTGSKTLIDQRVAYENNKI